MLRNESACLLDKLWMRHVSRYSNEKRVSKDIFYALGTVTSFRHPSLKGWKLYAHIELVRNIIQELAAAFAKSIDEINRKTY